METVRVAERVVPVEFDDRITSFLPAAHIADRASAQYFAAIKGVQVTYVADPRAIAAALPDARPTLWFAVPRVWAKIKAGVEAKRSEEHTSELPSLMRSSYAVFCLKKTK